MTVSSSAAAACDEDASSSATKKGLTKGNISEGKEEYDKMPFRIVNSGQEDEMVRISFPVDNGRAGVLAQAGFLPTNLPFIADNGAGHGRGRGQPVRGRRVAGK